jgi:hypothetical protein
VPELPIITGSGKVLQQFYRSVMVPSVTPFESQTDVQLGLHKDPHSALPLVEQDLRRRVFWEVCTKSLVSL